MRVSVLLVSRTVGFIRQQRSCNISDEVKGRERSPERSLLVEILLCFGPGQGQAQRAESDSADLTVL